MSYLKIICIEEINPDDPKDLFTHSDAEGNVLAIKQVGLFNGEEMIRTVSLNKALVEKLKQLKFEI